MQMAALETPTGCLVLSGSGQPPVDTVYQKAVARGVPVITTEWNTADIIAGIEAALVENSLRQEKKLAGLGELIKQNFEIKAVA